MKPSHPASRLTPEQCLLLARHPRESWRDNPRLGDLASFWLQRHGMFRQLDAAIGEGARAFINGKADAAAFRRWFAHVSAIYAGQLHEHHHVEDHHYFPIFRTLDPRLSAGFDILDADHGTLDAALHEIAAHADSVNAASPEDRHALRDAAARFLERHETLGRHLVLHLDDEEDLIIPILVEHGA